MWALKLDSFKLSVLIRSGDNDFEIRACSTNFPTLGKFDVRYLKLNDQKDSKRRGSYCLQMTHVCTKFDREAKIRGRRLPIFFFFCPI